MVDLINASPKERANYLYQLSDEQYGLFLQSEGAEKVPFSRCLTHVHSDMGSPLDSILTNKQYIDTAHLYGTKYLTITDHGCMYDVQALYDECQKAGDIKVIIGCEFYVCDDDVKNNKLKHTRVHLCAYSMNKTGYLALVRLVTESNYRIIKIGKQQFPCISRKMLMNYVGPGTEGHGNVILTSACIGGVLTGIIFEQKDIAVNLSKMHNIYDENRRIYDNAIIAKNKVDELEIRKKVTRDKDELARIKTEVAEYKNDIKKCNQKIKTLEKYGVYTIEEYFIYLSDILKELQTLKSKEIPPDKIVDEMTNAAMWYEQCAGHGNFFIEVQNHGLEDEAKYEPVICEIAHSLDIPLIAGIDAHMQKKEDAPIRKYINSLRFNSWSMEESNEESYLKSDGDLYLWLTKIISKEDAIEAICNCMRLAERCSVELHKENHYPIYPLNEEELELVSKVPDYF